jgi:hypothetical protein
LVLAAEYERLAHLRGSLPFVADIENWDAGVIETLFEIGFFEIVGFARPAQGLQEAGDHQVLRMQSGDTADSLAVNELIDNLKQLYPEPEESKKGLLHLYGAMVEAVVNVVRHAYPIGASFRFKPIGKWWMTGAVDKNARRTTAVVFDQGMTIPGTLQNWEKYAGWLTRMRAISPFAPDFADPKYDGEAIAAAVEEAASSTGQPHRGHGLEQMRAFVDQCRDGRLRIMSRCGEVVFRPGDKPEIRTHEVSIGGTLIEWNVLL